MGAIVMWSNRLKERRGEGSKTPLVWWVTQGDAERAIRAARERERAATIKDIREALMAEDCKGNSLLSCLVQDTEYPRWDGEEETIRQLARLGLIGREEYDLKMFFP
jgi:hypothetical protein